MGGVRGVTVGTVQGYGGYGTVGMVQGYGGYVTGGTVGIGVRWVLGYGGYISTYPPHPLCRTPRTIPTVAPYRTRHTPHT